MIQPILYSRIEQKNEIEREMFSKLSPEEREALAKAWMDFLSTVSQASKVRRKSKAEAETK